MFKGHRIGVVVPAYNEKILILETLQGIPAFVDRIFVVEDGSNDGTAEIIQQQQRVDPRIELIRHATNQGLGQSLIDGYLASRASDVDVTAIMAGDNQMDPIDLPPLISRITEEGYDYVKGNRLLHSGIGAMPTYRFVGNAILTILTKFATGYYRLMDPQCGYTAIRNTALKRIPIETMTRGYGYNADILCMLNIQRFRVTDTEVRPVYGRERSKIKLWKYVPKTSWLLIKLFFRRLWKRYVVLDFHPLVLFYLFAAFNLLFLVLPFSIRLIYLWLKYQEFAKTTMTILVFSALMAFQSALFAVWMDMDYNNKEQ